MPDKKVIESARADNQSGAEPSAERVRQNELCACGHKREDHDEGPATNCWFGFETEAECNCQQFRSAHASPEQPPRPCYASATGLACIDAAACHDHGCQLYSPKPPATAPTDSERLAREICNLIERAEKAESQLTESMERVRQLEKGLTK